MALIDEIYARTRRRNAVSMREDAPPETPQPAAPIYDSPEVQQITDQRRLRAARIARSAALRTPVPSDPAAFAARASAIGAANDTIDTIEGMNAPVQRVQSVGEIRRARSSLAGQATREIERQMNERIASITSRGGDPSADPELQRLAEARTKWGVVGRAASTSGRLPVDGQDIQAFASGGPTRMELVRDPNGRMLLRERVDSPVPAPSGGLAGQSEDALFAQSLADAERAQVGQRQLAERQAARRGAYSELYRRMVQPEAVALGESQANLDAGRQQAAYDRAIAEQQASNTLRGTTAAGEMIPGSDETAMDAVRRRAAIAAATARARAEASQANLAGAEAEAQIPGVANEADVAALGRRATLRQSQQTAAFSMANIPDPGEWLQRAVSLATAVRDTPNEDNVRAFELGPMQELAQIAQNDPDGAEQLAIQLLSGLGLKPGEVFSGQKNPLGQYVVDLATFRPNRAANATARANRLALALSRFVTKTPKTIGYQALP